MAVERTVTIPQVDAHTASQTIVRVNYLVDQYVEVVINTGGKYSTHSFSGEQYSALMSANPVWAPNKPAGVFRPEDLFSFMDFLEAQ